MSYSNFFLVQVLFSLTGFQQASPESCPTVEKRDISSIHEAFIASRFDSFECLNHLNLIEVCFQNTTDTIQQPAKITDSCQHISRQDQYLLQLTPNATPFPVLCVLHHHMTGDGWLVIQQRVDGSENFFRNWIEYREGFGDLNREFWLGLEHIHQITSSARHELLIEIGSFGHDHFGWARYSSFVVGDESQKFILQELGSYSGTIGDSMTPNLGKKFSTYDNDNERSKTENCAARYKGAWWYDHCYVRGANLNGPYAKTDNFKSIIWWSYGYQKSLGFTRMMLRRVVQNE